MGVLWNAASGAAHGQVWFGIAGFELLAQHEFEPGHVRTVTIPDLAVITEMIDAACAVLYIGTFQRLELGGHDPDLIEAEMRDIHARMPKPDEPIGDPR